jgi:C-terminal peptidase prc
MESMNSSDLLSSVLALLVTIVPVGASEKAKPSQGGGETKLEQEIIKDFASSVMTATSVIAEYHIKKISQKDLLEWAIRGLYARLNEKIPRSIARQLTKIKLWKKKDRKRLLQEVRKQLGKRKSLEHCKDIDLALAGIFSRLEPDCEQLPQQEARDRPLCIYRHSLWLPTGIGLEIHRAASQEMVEVVTPIKDGPAYRAGLRAGDTIVNITRELYDPGKKLPRREVISTKGLSLDRVRGVLRGEPGTQIKLTFKRTGIPKELKATITRQAVKEETVLGIARNADDSWNFLVDSEKRIAYIRLTHFASETHKDLARVLAEVKKQSVKGIVLDLRFNSGGLIFNSFKCAELFVDKGLIMWFRDRQETIERYTGKNSGICPKVPLVCLINGSTARASEIVVACLQDHKRAVIVGERSYGNTSLDTIRLLGDSGGEIRFAHILMCRPSGKNITKWMTSGKEEEEWGVTPDKGFVLKLSAQERDALSRHQHHVARIWPRDLALKRTQPQFKDWQLEMALAYLRKKIK